jgi:hypothetical protein
MASGTTADLEETFTNFRNALAELIDDGHLCKLSRRKPGLLFHHIGQLSIK